ncbi:phage tail assembly chaperone [Bordetella bronchiseptica]
MNEMIAGWDGPDMEFSDEAVGLLIQNYQGAVPALVQAYSLELLQARRKN